MDQIGTRKFHIFVRERVCRRLRVLLWKHVSDGEEKKHVNIHYILFDPNQVRGALNYLRIRVVVNSFGEVKGEKG